MNTAIVAPQESPEAKRAAIAADEMHAQALAHRVTDQPSADEAGHALRMVKDRAKAIEETRKAMTRPLDAAKAAIMDFFRPHTDKLAAAESHLKREVLGYQQREAEAARKRAEEERKRAEEAAEAARKAEADAFELASAGGDLDAITAQLEQAESFKRSAEVASVSSLVAASTKQHAAGVSTRSNWSARVVDLGALVKAAAANPELLRFIAPDLQALRKAATQAKAPSTIPGVEFVEEKIAAVR